jgi:ketosteroid isomerase-like protein
MTPRTPIPTVNLELDEGRVAPSGGGSLMHDERTGEEANGGQSGFDRAIEAYRRALEPFMKGDAGPALELFSRAEDVTLANPLGAPCRGPEAVGRAGVHAAVTLRDGSVRGFEEVARYSTQDLGYVVQLERTQARFEGSDTTMNPITLRVTMIFRREGDTWRVVHRHADPITTPRPITTLIES